MVYKLYQHYINYWRTHMPNTWIEICYERLVTEPKPVVCELLEYCHLPWNQACLEFHNSGRFINTASYDQVRRPLYTESVGRWYHYAGYLKELLDVLNL